MSTSNNNTPTDTPQAVRNEFNTFMSLRERGVDKDAAFRAADHVRRATNQGGDKGAVTAAVQVLRWLGFFVGVVIIVLGAAQLAMAAAPANTINLPVVSSNCRIKCSSSVPYPTPTATPFINEPVTPPAPIATVEVQ